MRLRFRFVNPDVPTHGASRIGDQTINTLYSAYDVERITGIARRTAIELVRAGLPSNGYLHGATTFVDADGLAALAAFRRLGDQTTERGLNVKVSAASPREDGDGLKGWHSTMTLEQVQAAAGRWWPVSAPQRLVDDRAALVVTIGGVVVYVAQITGATPSDTGRWAFQLAPPTEAQSAAYAGVILTAQRGPLVQWLGYPE